MSKVRKKKRTAPKVIGLAVILIGGAGAVWYSGILEDKSAVETAAVTNYKEEKVRYGSVASGIMESGSVTFGSLEQVFSVSEITEVSDSSSDASSGSSQSTTGSSMAGAQMSMGGMASADMGSMMSSGSSGSSSSSSDTSISLEVEEIYVSVGQEAAVGDALLKITEESVEEYRIQLEAAVKSAELQVQQEEINVESKKAEADYNYEMYIAEGETAEETYNATITSLENDVTELEEELQESADLIAEYEEDEANGEDVEEELEEERENYTAIEADLQIARNNLTTQSIEAKQTYENAMTNYRYADKLYEIDTDGLEDDLNDAKDTLEDAEEALTVFNEVIGDGTVYSEYAGKVMSVAYAAGDTLTNESTIVTFSDVTNATMTVSVSQEDISSISVGNTVNIELDAYENETFGGEVASIETSSSNSSTVNYDVEVKFTGDISKVYSGMTGGVTFVVKEQTDTLYISNRAVHLDGTRSWVKVLNDDGSIEEVTIETGFSNGNDVEIISGLSEGQTVLIESQVNQ